MTSSRGRILAAAMLAVSVLLGGWGLVRAALSRSVVVVDGDPDVASLDSEDFLLTQAQPGSPTTEFGSAVAYGDVNGDGLADAIVGQRAENRIFIYFGTSSPSAAAYLSDPNAADIVIRAPAGAADGVQGLGFSVAAGDLDADGFADIVTGAPFSDPGGIVDAGRAFVILGGGFLMSGQDFPLDSPPGGVDVVTLTRGSSTKAGDLLGFAVGAGDLASVTERFVVVTARGADSAVSPFPVHSGVVHLATSSAMPVAGVLDLTSTGVTFNGDGASDAFGESVATCDVDGNGDDDILVGAIFGDGPGNIGPNRGEVAVFLGENLVSMVFAGNVPAAFADLTIHGGTNGDNLGYSLACGDLDGDGRDDIAAGGIFADSILEARPTAGEVHIIGGRPSQVDPNSPAGRELIDPATGLPQTPIDLSIVSSPGLDPAPDGASLSLFGATTADQLGFSLAAGDLNGDGFADLMAGARRYDRDQSRVNVGITYILLGSAGVLDPAGSGLTRGIDLHQGTARPVDVGFDPNTPIDHLPDRVDGVIIGATRNDHSGFSIAASDMNGDGSAEVMISAIGDPAQPGFRGEVYIISFIDQDGDGAGDLVDLDNDNDGIPDADELAGTYGFVLDPRNPDTDGDGIQDGTELGATCMGGGGAIQVACDDLSQPFTSTDPNIPLHFIPDSDPSTTTNPLDADSDDDGLADGAEDANANGAADAGETDSSNHDTDSDGVFDGTEAGLTAPLPDTDLGAGHFVADADAGASTTDPANPDSDGDGLADGTEDADGNGAVAGDLDFDHAVGPSEIWTETDPADADTDADGLQDGNEVSVGSDPLDQDTDDDGLADGDALEPDPSNPDADGDGLNDGLEAGVTTPVAGRNGTPDSGPGEDGTDPTSPNFVTDADAGASTTDPALADSDNDGLADGIEDADGNGAVAGDLDLDNVVDPAEIWTETSPTNPDTDGDGIGDGNEDFNRNGSIDPGESNPLDADTDDDGLADGVEDADHDGLFGTQYGESSPLLADSDGDGILDGTEAGILTGAPGPNGTPDAGPGGDGTDPTSPNFRPDADPSTTTEPWDADTDDDGLPDGWIDGFTSSSRSVVDGIASVFEGEDLDLDGAFDPMSETNPIDKDTDNDGVQDGVERGIVSPGVLGPDGQIDPGPGMVSDGTGGSVLFFDLDEATVTDPLDGDSDEDGLSESEEDDNGNGRVDPGETDPIDPDTDGDSLPDGLERGIVTEQPDTDPNSPFFIPDADPNSTTDPTNPDTDGGGVDDGTEDVDKNGRFDPGERDPNDPNDDMPDLEFTDVLDGNPVSSIALAGTIFIRLQDADENTDSGTAQMVQVFCDAVDLPPFDGETVMLTENASDSGIFVGSLPTDPNAPGDLNDGVLSAQQDETVVCQYIDDDDPTDVRENMLIVLAPAPPPAVPEPVVQMEMNGTLSWLMEGPPGLQAGQMSANIYRGDLAALRSTGVITQEIVACGLPGEQYDDPASPAPGQGFFYIVTAVIDGIEGSLGTDSAGNPRPFQEQCAQ